MTFKKLMDGLFRADPMDLLIWSQWYVKKEISCRDCLNTYKVQRNELPNCVKCGLPTAKLKKSIFKETTKNEKN